MTIAATIVIPAFNGHSFLPRALESLRAQTRDDFDVVVVSDDGTDYSGIGRWILGDRVRHTHTASPASGPAIARVTGIRLSSSPVVGFLDVDDEYAPRRLERLIPLALEYGAATSNLHRIDDASGEFVNSSCPQGKPRDGMLHEKHIPWLDGPLSPLVRRDCLPEYPDMWLMEDLFFLLRVVARVGGRMRVVDEPECLYRYLVQKKSLSYGTDKDELTTKVYADVLGQARHGGPLFEGVSKEGQEAFWHCFTLKATRSRAYDLAKLAEPELDFQKFSPRFDAEMARLTALVPEHLRAWAE